METDSFDEVDRHLVHALVIAPRAPFRLFADAAEHRRPAPQGDLLCGASA